MTIYLHVYHMCAVIQIYERDELQMVFHFIIQFYHIK